MEHLVLEGVKPYDGRYEFDLEDGFSYDEWGWIKRFSGYLPLTADEAFAGGDAGLYVAFALIALRRAGKIDDDTVAAARDRIGSTKFGATIRLESDSETEADAGPPARNSSGKTPSSGAASQTSSARSDGPAGASGAPGSASSVLAPARSGT